jgi:predicted membrane protein
MLWLALVIMLMIVLVAQMTDVITFGDIIANFFLFLVVLVIIAILAIIGAMFVGVFISHRIFSVKAFTPFEEEMLRMREEVAEIKEALERMDDQSERSERED